MGFEERKINIDALKKATVEKAIKGDLDRVVRQKEGLYQGKSLPKSQPLPTGERPPTDYTKQPHVDLETMRKSYLERLRQGNKPAVDKRKEQLYEGKQGLPRQEKQI